MSRDIPVRRLAGRRDRVPRDLTPAERRLWEAYPRGALVDLTPAGEKEPPAVRGAVIAALLLGGRPAVAGTVTAVRLRGARVTGPLTVSGGTVTCPVLLDQCHLDERPDFSGATANQVRITGCTLPGFDGGGLSTSGYLSLSGSLVTGELNLSRARLSGGLRLNRTQVRNPGGYSLFGGGLTVEAGAFFRGATLTGTTRLSGARFTGALFLEGATLTETPGGAPSRDHLEPSGQTGALVAANITVEDTMECANGFTAEGAVHLRGARINGTLSFDGGALRVRPGGRALHLGHAHVGELILTPREPVRGDVQLGYSHIGVILDSETAWPPNIRLTGLVYESLRGAPIERRLDWVSRNPRGYRPQPYEQLAAYFRRIGRDELARRTQLRKLRARRRTQNIMGRAIGVLLDYTVGYGYRPWLAALWLTLLLVTGTVVFGHDRPHPVGPPGQAPHFQAFVYTLDLLLPFETFGLRSTWHPADGTQWLAYGLTAAGWVLATVLVAGAARVLRRPA